MKENINLDIPRPLELLCSLLETTPEKLVQGFVDDLCRTQQSNGPDERILAAEYFLRRGYDILGFDYDLAEEMLMELECIRYERYQFGDEKKVEYRQHLQRRIKEWYTRRQPIKKTPPSNSKKESNQPPNQ